MQGGNWEKECVPCPSREHGSFRDLNFWSTLLVTLLAVLFMCSKNAPALFTTVSVDMASNKALFSQTSSVVLLKCYS